MSLFKNDGAFVPKRDTVDLFRLLVLVRNNPEFCNGPFMSSELGRSQEWIFWAWRHLIDKGLV